MSSYIAYILAKAWKKATTKAGSLPDFETQFSSDETIQLLDKIGVKCSGSQLKNISLEYDVVRASVEDRLPSVFDDKYFQCGGLEDESFLLYTLLKMTKPKHIAEVGVANGYSSAFIFRAAAESNSTVYSFDRPRFEGAECSFAKAFVWLVEMGLEHVKKSETKTVYDLRPGGVVPKEKYMGWLIDPSDKLMVDNKVFVGDVFSSVRHLPEEINFAVIDAMKGYQERMNLLEKFYENLSDGGVLILDGAWVNSAWEDFANKVKATNIKHGRLGILRK